MRYTTRIRFFFFFGGVGFWVFREAKMGVNRWPRVPMEAGYLADLLPAGIWGFVGGQDGANLWPRGMSSGAFSGFKNGDVGFFGEPTWVKKTPVDAVYHAEFFFGFSRRPRWAQSVGTECPWKLDTSQIRWLLLWEGKMVKIWGLLGKWVQVGFERPWRLYTARIRLLRAASFLWVAPLCLV